MTTIPAPVGALALAECAMKRVPSDDASLKSCELAEPPAIGRIGGRESLSTHMASSFSGLCCYINPTLARQSLRLWPHAYACPLRLGSIRAGCARRRVSGTGPADPANIARTLPRVTVGNLTRSIRGVIVPASPAAIRA